MSRTRGDRPSTGAAYDDGLLDASTTRPRDGGASFRLRQRLARLAFAIAWTLLARWTPPFMRGWRRQLLNAFGARCAPGANVYGSVKVWYPPFLTMDRLATLGPRVRCYNQAPIHLGAFAVVSQDASLCAGTHDYNDPDFQLVTRPITIGPNAWIAAEAFVGPGVTIGEGAVLGARAVAVRDIEPGMVCAGNPARPIRARAFVPAFIPEVAGS